MERRKRRDSPANKSHDRNLAHRQFVTSAIKRRRQRSALLA
jgi:hypothetical protein